jgi:ribosome biogenesis protein Tsr3
MRKALLKGDDGAGGRSGLEIVDGSWSMVERIFPTQP